MNKLKLTLDELSVESFDTTSGTSGRAGTVHGNAHCCCCCCNPCCCAVPPTNNGENTCQASCNGTCNASCNGTCDATCNCGDPYGTQFDGTCRNYGTCGAYWDCAPIP